MRFEEFWRNKTVFITGNTGFKGSWLSIWLHSMGAKVFGYALPPSTKPSLFALATLENYTTATFSDIRNGKALTDALRVADPDIVFHLAAQPLVRESYNNPVETYEINVMGTINLLEAVRKSTNVKAVVNVTTDKCYENKEWNWGYRENDRLGGYDPYSNSKACSELVTEAYRNSFFNKDHYSQHGVAIASARAGNVIGGGDWAADRLIPDCLRALSQEEPITIRNPQAIRPWQHVLEPLRGYLMLAQRLYEDGPGFAEGWNFGPDDSDAKSVAWIVKAMCEKWGNNASYIIDKGPHLHEATYLKLDCSKAKASLGWHPLWNLDQTLNKVIDWHRAYQAHKNMHEVCLQQIQRYIERQNEISVDTSLE